MKNLVYLFAGLFIGVIGFWTFHLVYPGIFHNQAVAKLPWRPRSIKTDLPLGEEGARIKYGHLLITETSDQIGPLAEDEKMRFAGNNLTCNNCHLNAGTKIGSGSFIGVTNRFPQFRGRENKMGTMEERINGCMERSMSGRKIPENGKEMQAMIAYMKWLSQDVPAEIEKEYEGYVKIEIPDFKADPEKGKELYQIRCQLCHLENGEGWKFGGEEFTGYLYPPLGGDDTYNDGAGMNRVLTAAEFIKGNMPFGATKEVPLLTDEQSYHIAAYINTFKRPNKENREVDFPDKKFKPVSTPYGPWTDDFSEEQHKFGPFLPIIEFYKKEYDLDKTK